MSLVAGCSFSGATGNSDPADDPPLPDSPPCKPGFVDVCALTIAAEPLVFTTSDLNTDTDTRCQEITPVGGVEVCVLYYPRIDLPAEVTVTTFGARPLALVGRDQVLVTGTLDASTKLDRVAKPGPGHMLCDFTSNPQPANGGGGGGAGGTFLSQGGAGGMGNLDNVGGGAKDRAGGAPGAAVASPMFLRGGCDGQKGGNGGGGSGGLAGGGVYIYGAELQISGAVLASGSAGEGGAGNAGGGGGGSGGMIMLEGDEVNVLSGALLLTTGGGGGQGGNGATPGDPGAEAVTIAAAQGGHTGNAGGDGGDGSVDAATVTDAGENDNGGGGGGGGGSGLIVVRNATPMLSGELAPPAMVVAPATLAR